ncbi:ARM repeat-containing protein [Ramicandelaber brevisporus]|nr:ARM repeat-containing protein [Ramicandelaber brevisporus]
MPATVTDLIVGLRAGKATDESAYVSAVLAELHTELNGTDRSAKARAVTKLAHLHQLGLASLEPAAFRVLEVMASPDPSERRIGYLAAGSCLSPSSDLLTLTANLFRKDMASIDTNDISLALDTLAVIVSRDLTRELVGDVLDLLDHHRSSPRIRAKTLAVLCKMVRLDSNVAFHGTFTRLRSLIDDPDETVSCAAVNTICELARMTDPTKYLALVPRLFRLLVTTRNSWTLIKLIKLFASLAPREPRLQRKLFEPFQALFSASASVSIKYEVVHASIVGGLFSAQPMAGDGGPTATEIATFARLCADHLHSMIESDDSNLKFTGLVSLHRLQSTTFGRLVHESIDAVLACLDDPDVTIRKQALQLIPGLSNHDTFARIAGHLSSSFTSLSSPPAEYHKAATLTLAVISRHGEFMNVKSPDWLLRLLVDIVQNSKADVGDVVGSLLMDMALHLRQSARSNCVRLCAWFLSNYTGSQQQLLQQQQQQQQQQQLSLVHKSSNPSRQSLLSHVYMILGEFAAEENRHLLPTIIDQCVRMTNEQQLDLGMHALVKMTAALPKMLVHWSADLNLSSASDQSDDQTRFSTLAKESLSCAQSIRDSHLSLLCDPSTAIAMQASVDLSRATRQLELILASLDKNRLDTLEAMRTVLYGAPLTAVQPDAQPAVQKPAGLDLDTCLCSAFDDPANFVNGPDSMYTVRVPAVSEKTQAVPTKTTAPKNASSGSAFYISSQASTNEKEKPESTLTTSTAAAAATTKTATETAPTAPDDVDNIPIISLDFLKIDNISQSTVQKTTEPKQAVEPVKSTTPSSPAPSAAPVTVKKKAKRRVVADLLDDTALIPSPPLAPAPAPAPQTNPTPVQSSLPQPPQPPQSQPQPQSQPTQEDDDDNPWA